MNRKSSSYVSFDAKLTNDSSQIGQPDNLKGYVDTPTNQPVSAVFRSAVQDVLAVVQEKVGLLDRAISQSHDPSDSQIRLEHRDQCAALIDRLKIIIAPHKRLPAELLAHIFYSTLPDDFRVHVPGRLFKLDTGGRLPWSFGHICSFWRQVALTDYRLWNRIQIHVEYSKPLHRQLLETVLLRSGSAPLDIEMKADHSFISVSDVVLPQAGRISRLKLRAYPGNFSPFLCNFSMPGQTLSFLTEATLFGYHLEIPDGGLRIFGDCPLLRKLEIYLCRRQSGLLKALHSLHVPFSQLTELTLHIRSSPHTILCILKDTPNLVRCSITSRDFVCIDDPAFDLVLPHLENLKLLSDELEILIRILRHIIPPSLLQLNAECPSAWRTSNALPTTVLALINRSSCHLTHIKLKGDLTPIIERSHCSLVSIDTVFAALPASTAQQIARRELILPHLEKLRCALDLDTFTDLKAMVEALWSDGDGTRGSAVRRMFCSKCKIASVSTAGEEDFNRWEEEMKVLLKRLSIDGWVEFLGDEEQSDDDFFF